MIFIGVEIGSEEKKELILVVGTGSDDFGGVGLVKGRVSDEVIIFFPFPFKNPLCIENSILSYCFEGGICDDEVGGAEVASYEADAPDVPSWTHAEAIQCGAFATICIA